MLNPAHFDLHSLRLFVLASETGSLTAAAERAHVSLSSASKRIAELERSLDCALFVRQPRGLELTAAGQSLLAHARRVLEDVQRMAGELAEHAAGQRGQVRIHAHSSAVIEFLPTALASFSRAYPAIGIRLHEQLSERVVQAVASGRADLGIFADNVNAGALQRTAWRTDQLVLLVPAGHVLDGSAPLAFASVLEHEFVCLPPGSSLAQRLHSAATAAGRQLRIRIQAGSFDGVCRMIEAGLGIGVLPLQSVRPQLLGSTLQALPLTDAWATRTLYLGVRDDSALSHEARRLYQWLRESGG